MNWPRSIKRFSERRKRNLNRFHAPKKINEERRKWKRHKRGSAHWNRRNPMNTIFGLSNQHWQENGGNPASLLSKSSGIYLDHVGLRLGFIRRVDESDNSFIARIIRLRSLGRETGEVYSDINPLSVEQYKNFLNLFALEDAYGWLRKRNIEKHTKNKIIVFVSKLLDKNIPDTVSWYVKANGIEDSSLEMAIRVFNRGPVPEAIAMEFDKKWQDGWRVQLR